MEGISGTLPAPLDTILTVGASVIASARYSSIAVYALCVYDWLLSIAEECELIWGASFSTMKLAYLVCRYYTLLIFPVYIWIWLLDHTQDFCRRAVHPLYGAMVIYPLSAQAVILMRAYAFTGRNHTTLYLLCTCYFILAGAEIWLFGHWFDLESGIFQLLGSTGCYANDGGAAKLNLHYGSAQASAIVLSAAFFMDLLMMGVVFMHCYHHRSFQGALGKFFVWQGFVAFIIMAALNLISAVTYAQSARQYDGIVIPFLLVIPNVLACRLILSLRRRVHPTQSFVLKQRSMLVGDALRVLELQEASSDPDVSTPAPITSTQPDDWG